MANFKKNKELNKKQTTIIVVFIILVILIVISLVVTYVIDNVRNGNDEDDAESIYFVEPDFDLNILEDENYLCLDRFMLYTNGALSSRIYTSDDAYSTDLYSMFFFSWFDAMINGEYEKFSGYYTDSYLKENGNFEPFTMQQIYDMRVELYERGQANKGKCEVTFKVSFSIRRNDGTLWNKVGSNVSRPMLVTIIEDTKKDILEINSVDYIKVQK